MPLSSEDHVAILRHLRSSVRESLAGVDDRIMADFGWEDQNPRGNLRLYLHRLEQIVAHGAQQESDRVLGLLHEFIVTPNGHGVSDARVVLTPAEQEQYGLEYASVVGLPEADELLAQLRLLVAEVFDQDRPQ